MCFESKFKLLQKTQKNSKKKTCANYKLLYICNRLIRQGTFSQNVWNNFSLSPTVVGACHGRLKIWSGSSVGYPEYSGLPVTQTRLNVLLKIMFWVYILKSEKDNSLYIGQTSNIEKRLLHHNEGLSKYTSRKIPWKIVYTEKYGSRNEAIKRERFLKKQRNRDFYNRLIKNWQSGSDD